MKKIATIAILLAAFAAAGRAQESRQDVSLSVTGLIEPPISASTNVYVHATPNYGALASYRYMITPSSAIEANYGFNYSNSITYYTNPDVVHVHTRNMEISAAYVHSFVFRKFNPFVEGGAGAMIFLPVTDSETNTLDTKRQTKMGFVYGAGVAYEISPSFDIRAQYRAFFTHAPDFGCKGGNVVNLTTNAWYNISEPTIGVAYHF